MKNLIVVLPLCFAPSCGALGIPGPGTELTAEEQASADSIGNTVGAIGTAVTGNPAVGVGLTVLVGGAAAWFMRRRKRGAPPAG